jgi:hypothetical protein
MIKEHTLDGGSGHSKALGEAEEVVGEETLDGLTFRGMESTE